MSYI
ncbi:hypothetical protein AYI68_g3707, partial [Smittium mucronatum]|jgi:hypothetical protein